MAHDDTSSSTPRTTRSPGAAVFGLAASKLGAPKVSLLAGVVVGTATLWTAPAQASTAYAYLLSTAFDFNGGCPACHTNVAGGLGTVTKPFGQHLMTLGLVANNTESLYAAVAILSESDHDSDGDSISDFDELSPDGDPNDPNVFPADATPVPPAPPGTPPTTTPPTPPTATPPTATPPPTTTPTPPATATPPSPAPNPTPAPATKADDGGCSLSAPNGSRSPAAMLAVLGLAWLLRRRR